MFPVYSVQAGPDLRGGANWAVAQQPPQPSGLHKNSKKIITQGNIKMVFETDNLEQKIACRS